jgi:hypothetical protein
MKLRELISEGLDEIDHADALDSSTTSPNDLMQSGKVIGDIEGNDIVMISKGNQTVYILKVDDRATAFIGFEGKNLKNIKNFTETPGVIRALIGYLVHKKNMKIVVSPNEPLTLDGLKWITKLITDPRGLVIKDHAGQDIDPIQLKQEWQTAKKTGTPGTTGITISENIQFGNKIRQSELKRNTDSLLIPFNFYSVKTKKQGVAEGLATKQQYVAAKFIDEFGDGDHWYIKGTPDLVQKFVTLANSIEQASLQGTEYEPGQGTMGQIHSQLGNDQAPQWKIVAATNLDDIKPITNSVINVLSRVNLKDPGDEFMSDLLWRLEEKGLAQVSNDEGVAEDWSTSWITGGPITEKDRGKKAD